MKIGYFGINFGLGGDPDTMVDLAQTAEAAGLDSVWTGEHVVLPDPQAPPSPAAPQTPFLDPAVALGHIAAHTERVRLGTGIIILPQRNPLVLAKELATVDVVSKGRLIFGLGAGYLYQEFAALGAPFEHRGSVTDEAIEAIRALWTMEKPEFEGEFFSFSGVDAQPRPVQSPHPPIVIGGMSKRAARRAARAGNRWYGFMTDVEASARSIGWIEGFVGEGLRPEGMGGVEISVTPPKRIDAELVHQYEDVGVDRLIALSSTRNVDDVKRDLEALGQLAS